VEWVGATLKYLTAAGPKDAEQETGKMNQNRKDYEMQLTGFAWLRELQNFPAFQGRASGLAHQLALRRKTHQRNAIGSAKWPLKDTSCLAPGFRQKQDSIVSSKLREDKVFVACVCASG